MGYLFSLALGKLLDGKFDVSAQLLGEPLQLQFLGLLGGSQSAVYATEVSPEEYYCYTTEETEKLELQRLTEKLDGNIELAIKQLAESKRNK